MDKEQRRIAFYEYLAGRINSTGEQELMQWLVNPENEEEVKGYLDQYWEDHAVQPLLGEQESTQLYQTIQAALQKQATPAKVIPGTTFSARRLLTRLAVAASVLLVIGVGTYFAFFHRPAVQPTLVSTQPVKDIEAPRGTRAVITLADGRMVPLDSLGSGVLVQEGNVNVVKNADGSIAYSPGMSSANPGMVYNTLSNPRGSKVIDLILSDGSHVWLNAGSSITYPVVFNGSERRVDIKGEAYFEVAHLAGSANTNQPKGKGAIPFIVRNGNMEVKVLGTHFNVNAYEDEEAIRVTLLEGSVEVSNQKSKVRIHPGEQAAFSQKSNSSPQIVVQTPDLEQVMAWKNGFFQFNRTDIVAIMKQIERWYDVKVVFSEEITAKDFTGEIARTENISEVLGMLEKTGAIHFNIQGRTVIVRK